MRKTLIAALAIAATAAPTASAATNETPTGATAAASNYFLSRAQATGVAVRIARRGTSATIDSVMVPSS